MPMRVYEAMLARRDSLERVQAVRRAVERAGGTIKFAPPTASGMVLVTLILPDEHTPQEFLPDLPFYPV